MEVKAVEVTEEDLEKMVVTATVTVTVSHPYPLAPLLIAAVRIGDHDFSSSCYDLSVSFGTQSHLFAALGLI
ncbi:hypothetical protein [Zavarzinella formosa]|uniref:hypothetical protein n=1 Tax=Zavarzinella formosa TaxID=360055 RepID=UPI0002EF8DD3|nr:hypothetical protein [Zavarzinella formosa]